MNIYGIKNKTVQIFIDEGVEINNIHSLFTKMNSNRTSDDVIASDDGTWINPSTYSLFNVSRTDNHIYEIKFSNDLNKLPNGFNGCIKIKPNVIENFSGMPYIENPIYLVHKLNMYDSTGNIVSSTIRLESCEDGLILGALKYINTDTWKYIPYNKYQIGSFGLLPNRQQELPYGWYFRNGDNFLLDSPQGQVLNNLSDYYKLDHKIIIKTITDNKYINVPSAFSDDGRGLFERPINNRDRKPGSIEYDAMRKITAGLISNNDPYNAFIGDEFITTGAFSLTNRSSKFGICDDHSVLGDERKIFGAESLLFDSSKSTPTSTENRPINIGLTPAIYLGV